MPCIIFKDIAAFSEQHELAVDVLVPRNLVFPTGQNMGRIHGELAADTPDSTF